MGIFAISIASVLACAAGVQFYMLSHSITLLKTPIGIRYVFGNELVLLWASLAGVFTSWSALHLLVKRCRPEAQNITNTKQINWLPVSVWPQIILWTSYIVAISTLGTGISVFLYMIGFRKLLVFVIISYAIPAIVAAAAMPGIAKALRTRASLQKQFVLDSMGPSKTSADKSTISLHADSRADSPLPNLDATSIHSGMTRVSGSAKCADIPTDIFTTADAPSKHNSLSPNCELSIFPSNTTTLAPRTQISFVLRLSHIVFAVFRNGPTAVIAALLSLLIYALLLNGVFEQNQHNSTLPELHSTPVSVVVPYSDNIERTLAISVSCMGGLNDESTHAAFQRPPSKATILLEHVSGYPSFISRSIQTSLIKQNHRVCVYDRPGYMFSPQGYAPISHVVMERALSIALHHIGEKGPFYVVGHRSGSEYAQLFSTINADVVVGMAFIYPTELALLGLLMPNQSALIREATAQAMSDSSLLPESNLEPARLNFQRALAALGTWMTNPPTISNSDTASQNATEWALSSPYLAQAQFFEMSQQPQLVEVIRNLNSPLVNMRKLPVILFGVQIDPSIQTTYKETVSDRFVVETVDQNNLQSLSIERIAAQISLHILKLH
ncbi:hypothetical protein COEREDRAFT_6702 [Coemansia reversa NRRL 1564]|uniref:AB hydrolase-1 domain-containing protein n=1 Tax=Coemansia reversa (strain ATCC 12441 / NRRL 1564) TaxID=763665 RepID=A0A2G5BHK8_COERN|nr:hypothetical protein COEREDRAFT_6702 [Coemansia reversa NRRL 1564]|eukprot:PIA18471.1 hypothetical protein COEREDRAFT_6702 [Coemansia reversa NRRL 1564]